MEEKLAEAASALAKVPAPPPVSETLGSKDSETRHVKAKAKQRQNKGRAEDLQMKMLHRFCTDPPQMLCDTSAPRNTIKEPEQSPVMKAADSVQ